MASGLAWLDFSEEEQRRAREVVQLFTQKESVDELGIGTVRDALSDSLFPGVSVIQTRARYFLFIPWLLDIGARRREGAALQTWVEREERKLIETLRNGGDVDGLIGRVAGRTLKILPSTIYWNALHRYGILRQSGAIEHLRVRRSDSIEDVTEQVERADEVWHRNLPLAPEGFPNLDRLDFALTPLEADWLAECICETVPGSLLAWLLGQRVAPDSDADMIWEDQVLSNAPGDLGAIVEHARKLSLVMHGAALLYNVLCAERSRELGLKFGDDATRDGFLEQFDAWRDRVAAERPILAAWDLGDFWSLVLAQNPRIRAETQQFIVKWWSLAVTGEARASDDAVRDFVATRERRQKGGQSRLFNDRMIGQWGGASGAAPLSFRWGQVRRMLTDIDAGRNRDVGA